MVSHSSPHPIGPSSSDFAEASDEASDSVLRKHVWHDTSGVYCVGLENGTHDHLVAQFMTLLSVIPGKLADRYGYKPFLAAGGILWTLSMILCVFAAQLWHFFVIIQTMAGRSTYLYEDILLHILDLASKDLVRTLMQTCRMFHEHGTKYLLKDGVSLTTDKQIMSFMLFVGSDSGRERQCILLLRELTLSRRRCTDDAQDSDLVQFHEDTAGIFLRGFFTAISSFGCLLRLTIYDSEEVLGLHPALPEAIAGLPTLTYLSVSSAGPCTVRMLKALRSTLFYANIGIGPEPWDIGNELTLEDQNPMWLLHRSQDTLRELDTTFSTSASDSPIYPHATVLNLDYFDIPQMQHYVRAFPNLRVLTTKDYCSRSRGESGGEDLDMRRAQNQNEQDRLGTWPSLERFRGTVTNLYLLGLRCPVGTLYLDQDGERFDPTMLHAVLGDACPRRLQLRFDGGDWLADPDFLATFAHPGVQALKRFDLIVNLQKEDRGMDISVALDPAVLASRIVVPLKNLVAFWLCLDCSWIRYVTYGEEPPLEPVEEALVGWDMDEFAHRMLQEVGASAKLQSVTVSIQFHRTRSQETVTIGATSSLS
ncbi:uncharacterized protein TRAVEDRAFT_49341 [Trametes versicolor FP-101664 SS1]|uniref:uncharacterized protein n=1 Tax=Trametes versicolor (strain FP-101664) TaxID=717944 RepID=UPI00046249BD|nr:uncharacterized protein TRAVEDRAFT_49341 [Trametes versicolor FP-101664 SS1]EIW56513.1 hypothetical protein TRAVEDRAFT_49341 [Trametes versicolor FP-101664 SS1]